MATPSRRAMRQAAMDRRLDPDTASTCRTGRGVAFEGGEHVVHSRMVGMAGGRTVVILFFSSLSI
jgi:hypothetical protein